MAEAAVAPRLRRFRAGILDLYLIGGVAGPFLTILVGVGLVMMLERALRLIHLLAASGADIAYLFPLMAQLAPYYLNLALPAAFMVALVLLVARLDDNLELEAMLASGLSLARIAAPLAAVGVLIALASLAAGGWLEPHARYEFRSLRAAAINAGRIGRLQPGAFYQPAPNLALTFDRRGEDGRVGGVFVWQRLANGTELVLTGRSARIGFVPGERLFGVALERGRYASLPAGASVPMALAFERLDLRESLLMREERWRRGWDQSELTLTELIAERRAAAPSLPRRSLDAELYGRLARAASIPLIPFLVLPLAFATKKGRRGFGILLGGALLAAFHHGLNLAERLARGGGADPAAAIFGAAGLCAVMVALVFLSGRHLPSHSPIAAALKPAGDAIARLRRGARPRRSPRGRTLATYLAWRLGKWTLISAAAIVLLLQMVDIFERGDAFVARGMGMADVGRYAWLRLPPMLQQAIPVAALAGAMTAFAAFGRTREMVAVRGAGISQYRVLAMALPVPVLLALSSFLIAEHVAPRSQAAFAGWWTRSEQAASPAATARWFRIGDEIVRAGRASADGGRLSDVQIFRRDREGLLAERLSAAAAVAGQGRWTLRDVARTRFDSGRAGTDRAARLDWTTPLRAEDVATFFSTAPRLSAAAARRSLDEAAPVSQAEALFATRLHRTFAEPLAPFIMLLLALPLAFVSPRIGVAWPALLYAGGGGLLYLVADGVLTVAGQVGYVPAAVGAWAAPLFFGLVGITILIYSER